VQRHVEQVHSTARLLDEAMQPPGVAGPVLAHGEQVAPGVLTDAVDPVAEHEGSDVFDGVQPKPVHLQLVVEPAAPVLHLSHDLTMIVVEVAPHQEIIVPVLAVDVRLELLASELVDRSIVFDRVEVMRPPLHARMAVAPRLEVEPRPHGSLMPVPDFPIAILTVDVHGPDAVFR
jgi:hypothetical protein